MQDHSAGSEPATEEVLAVHQAVAAMKEALMLAEWARREVQSIQDRVRQDVQHQEIAADVRSDLLMAIAELDHGNATTAQACVHRALGRLSDNRPITWAT